MVVQITPEQVSALWEIIGEGLERSAPPHVKAAVDFNGHILYSILSERAICWGYFEGDVGEQNLRAVALTVDYFDPISRQLFALIYSVFSFSEMPVSAWKEMLSAMKRTWADKGVTGIIAYTNQRGVISLAERLGGHANFALIQFPIENA